MIFLLFTLAVFGGWFLIASWLNRKHHGNLDWDAGIIISVSLFVISLALSVVINIAMWNGQISDKTHYQVVDEKIELNQKRADDISNKLRIVLVENYGEHEREIFSNMGSDGLQLLLIKYPELRASETFTTYADKMHELNDYVYEQKQEKIEIVRRMEYRVKNIFTFGFLYPNL